MAPRGKTPSLIGSGAGSSKIVTAMKKRSCKRWDGSIPRGNNCLEVSIPGTMGHKTYCKACYLLVLEKSRVDLAALEAAVSKI